MLAAAAWRSGSGNVVANHAGTVFGVAPGGDVFLRTKMTTLDRNEIETVCRRPPPTPLIVTLYHAHTTQWNLIAPPYYTTQPYSFQPYNPIQSSNLQVELKAALRAVNYSPGRNRRLANVITMLQARL